MSDEYAYLEDGTKVVVICTTPKGVLVSDVYGSEDDDCEEYIGSRSYLVDRVFDKPQTAKREEEVARLDSLIQSKRDELREIERKTEAAKKGSDEVMKLWPILDDIRAYMEGELKYAVVERWSSIVLLPVEEAVKDEDRYTKDRYTKDRKLVSLWGKSGGGMEWRINDYCDGSGGWNGIYLFRTHEEAYAKAVELAEVRFSLYRNGARHGDVEVKDLVAIGIPIPDDILKRNRKIALDSCTRVFNEALEKYNQAKASLEKIQMEWRHSL